MRRLRAIIVNDEGGPEVMVLGEWPEPVPGPGDVLLDVVCAGVNFHDVDQRIGLYRRELPYVPGIECAGTVAAVGSEVADVAVGDLVATIVFPSGAFAERVAVPAAGVVPVPEGVSAQDATALLLQGLTAHYLTHDAYLVRPGDTALVHAAAGGVGRILTQVLRVLGARVIGTVSTAEKEKVARDAGAHEIIRYTESDVAAEVAALTDGKGVDVVYDSVGQATFESSLAAVRTRGTVVLYGQSSGVVPPANLLVGALPRSIHLTTPLVPDFVAAREELLGRTADLFSWFRSGDVTVLVSKTYPLAETSAAYADLQERRTTGKLLLVP
jgi:NADPH2:quinone reductase